MLIYANQTTPKQIYQWVTGGSVLDYNNNASVKVLQSMTTNRETMFSP